MAEDVKGKGNVRITLDIELNEAVLDMARQAIDKMPQLPQGLRGFGQSQQRGYSTSEESRVR